MAKAKQLDRLYCNCADCDAVLLSRRFRLQQGEQHVAGRIKDRPYCANCLYVSHPDIDSGRCKTKPGIKIDPGVSEDGIRAMEER